MCHFFSFLSDGNGTYIYADWELRQRIIRGEIKVESDQGADSHSWLAKHFLKNGAEDRYNKYEYNPLTKVFTVDQINTEDDRVSAEAWCHDLDWKRIVKPLNLKPIQHPLVGKPRKPTNLDKALVREWASVGDGIRASVGDSIRDSVGASVRDSIRDSVWGSVWDSVRDSIRDSVWDSVRCSVLASVRGSVGESIWAYCGSFCNITYRVNTSPSNRLWERGFVASFDGSTYRLHSGKKAEIVWTYATSNKVEP